MKEKNKLRVIVIATAICCVCFSLYAQDDSDLAKQTQNPVSSLISVPFQNNFNFGVGPDDDLQYLLNIQPGRCVVKEKVPASFS